MASSYPRKSSCRESCTLQSVNPNDVWSYISAIRSPGIGRASVSIYIRIHPYKNSIYSHKIFCTELESSNYFRKILYEYDNNINNNHKNSNTFHTKYTSMLAPKVILNTQTIIGMQCMVISHRDQESPLSLDET